MKRSLVHLILTLLFSFSIVLGLEGEGSVVEPGQHLDAVLAEYNARVFRAEWLMTEGRHLLAKKYIEDELVSRFFQYQEEGNEYEAGRVKKYIEECVDNYFEGNYDFFLEPEFANVDPWDTVEYLPYEHNFFHTEDSLYKGDKMGMRLHPIKKIWRRHNTCDWKTKNKKDTDMDACADMVITRRFYQKYGGGRTLYMTLVDNPDIEFRILHLRGGKLWRNTHEGDTILSGETFARLGASGLATATHAHIEVRVNGILVAFSDLVDYATGEVRSHYFMLEPAVGKAWWHNMIPVYKITHERRPLYEKYKWDTDLDFPSPFIPT